MSYQPRMLEKFESSDASLSLTFPLAEYEYDAGQSLRNPYSPAVGADYAYDLLGTGVAIKDVASERLRFVVIETTPTLVDTTVDALRATMYRIGRGKLYSLDNAGVRRWGWARLAAMPELTWRAGQVLMKGSSAEFLRFSDWFASAQTIDTEAVTVSGQTWVVNNPGNIPAKLMTIQFKASAAGGFVNPKLENQTNGYVFETARDSASANDEIKLNTEEGTIERSTDNGASYSDDFAQIVLPTDQPVLSFQLEPGDNVIEYTGGGTPNLDVVFTFYAPFA